MIVWLCIAADHLTLGGSSTNGALHTCLFSFRSHRIMQTQSLSVYFILILVFTSTFSYCAFHVVYVLVGVKDSDLKYAVVRTTHTLPKNGLFGVTSYFGLMYLQLGIATRSFLRPVIDLELIVVKE
jgi:hypothetical protein